MHQHYFIITVAITTSTIIATNITCIRLFVAETYHYKKDFVQLLTEDLKLDSFVVDFSTVITAMEELISFLDFINLAGDFILNLNDFGEVIMVAN